VSSHELCYLLLTWATLEVRRYALGALKTRPKEHSKTPQQISRQPRRTTIIAGQEDDLDDFDSRVTSHGIGSSSEAMHADEVNVTDECDVEGSSEREEKYRHPDPYFAEHLNGLFSTLQFPPELARRTLTHPSHPSSRHGHNAAYSFMGAFLLIFLDRTIAYFLLLSGRRVLEGYLLLLLSSSPALHPKHDLNDVVQRTLNSHTLGQYVGSVWGLGRVMRWTPTIAADKLKPGEDNRELLKSVGLYKVQGDAVSAVMGGIFYQFVRQFCIFHSRLILFSAGHHIRDVSLPVVPCSQPSRPSVTFICFPANTGSPTQGGSVSHRVFHTRLLPNLLTQTSEGLPQLFHADAREACERFGGENGPLLLDIPTSQTQAQTLNA
jgi:hypothetical protein